MRGKSSSIEPAQPVAQYEEIRRTLLTGQHAEYLDKPLAHWVLPVDRRLPVAFLDRRLSDLLNTDFDDLAATPGVGDRKIRSFLSLLTRVAGSMPENGNGNGDGEAARRQDCTDSKHGSADNFDPSGVSQLVWGRWQESVRRCGLGPEPLGRVAPTLNHVTRVIWNTPLDEYLDVSLADLRKRKTYGEKRVRAILEVFHGLHGLIGDLGSHGQLTIRLVPRMIDEVERWVGQCLQRATMPNETELRECFIVPLIAQLRHDASRQITRLAEIRLGMGGPITSVRQTARQMGLTRARVYQLLDEINDILTIRWPLGRVQTYQLLERLESDAPPEMPLDQYRVAVELFYPGNRRGAEGIVDGK